MNMKEFIYVIIKFFAALIFVLFSLPYIYLFFNTALSIYRQEVSIALCIPWLANIVFYFIIIPMLWFKSDKIADTVINSYAITNEEDNSGLNLTIAQAQILDVGFILIGVYIVSQNLYPFLIISSDLLKSHETFNTRIIPQASIAIILALFLINGRARIISLIGKLRKAGI